MPKTHPYYADIMCAGCQGTLESYECGGPGEPCVPPNNFPYFRPSAQYAGTRAEVCKLLVLGAGVPIDTVGGPHFVDVPTCHPYYPYIETAYNLTIISGYADGTFRPGNRMMRGQFAVVLYRLLTQIGPLPTPTNATATPTPCVITFSDVQPTEYFYEAVRYLVCRGVMSGYPDETFRPYDYIDTMSRAEFARIAARAFTDCTVRPTPSPQGTCTPTAVPMSTWTGTPATSTHTPTVMETPITPKTTVTATTTPTPLGTPVPCPAGLQDVPAGHPDRAAIVCATCRGALENYPCGQPGEPCVPPGNYPYFRPGDLYVGSRADVCRLIVRSAGWDLINPADPTFSDVPVTHRYYEYVETAYLHGIFNGYTDGTFRPDLLHLRAQFAKSLVLATGWPLLNPADPTFTDVPPQDPFYVYVESAYAHGAIEGYPCGGPGEPCDPQNRDYFRPFAGLNTMTRAEMARIMAAAFPCGGSPTPTGSATPTPVCPAVTGQGSSLCIPTMGYYWAFNVNNQGSNPTTGTFTITLEISANSGGPWTVHQTLTPFSSTLQPGINQYSGNAGWRVIPPPDNYFRFRLNGEAQDGCWTLLATTTPVGICREATPVRTPTPPNTATPTPTSTFGNPSPGTPTPCRAIMGSATAGCAAPDLYSYSFAISNGCGFSVESSGNIYFEVAQNAAGSWSVHDQRPFQLVLTGWQFTAITGTFAGQDIPSEYLWYRMRLAGQSRGFPISSVTSPDQLCRAPTPTHTTTPSHTRTHTITPTSTPTLCSIQFEDVHRTDYFYEPVRFLYCRGVLTGYNHEFRPYNYMTRAQLAKVVVLGFELPLPLGELLLFEDVPPTHPFYPYVNAAATYGIVSGYQCGGPGEPCVAPSNRPYYRPYNLVTRGQLAKITTIAAGWDPVNPADPTFSDVAPGSTFYAHVETAVCHGIISGYACGGPGEPCDAQNRPYYRQYSSSTRGQLAKIVYLAVLDETPCAGYPGRR